MRDEKPRDVLLLSQGADISLDEVKRLNAVLASREDREARLSLMAARRAPLALRVAQVRWFAKHEPRTFLSHHGWLATVGDDVVATDCYEECKQIWFEQRDAHPDDLAITENAAWFVIWFDPDRGADILEEGSRNNPSPEWASRELDYLYHASELHLARRQVLALKALEAGFRMFRREQLVERRFECLSVMRECARLAGRGDCERLLLAASRAAEGWGRSEPIRKEQLQWVACANIALAGADATRAQDAFRRACAANIPPSTFLLSFATDLATAGGMAIVMTEVELWSQRYPDAADVLAEWASAIRRGERPEPPQLGPEPVMTRPVLAKNSS